MFYDSDDFLASFPPNSSIVLKRRDLNLPRTVSVLPSVNKTIRVGGRMISVKFSGVVRLRHLQQMCLISKVIAVEGAARLAGSPV